MRNYLELLALSDAELAKVDPVEMNLLVAKSIPRLAELDIDHYRALVDKMAQGVRRRLPHAEQAFQQNPHFWKRDVRFLRLAVLCEYLDCEVGIDYKEEDKNATKVWYTKPADLFLNGLLGDFLTLQPLARTVVGVAARGST